MHTNAGLVNHVASSSNLQICHVHYLVLTDSDIFGVASMWSVLLAYFYVRAHSHQSVITDSNLVAMSINIIEANPSKPHIDRDNGPCMGNNSICVSMYNLPRICHTCFRDPCTL